jgi:hypothetical protein
MLRAKAADADLPPTIIFDRQSAQLDLRGKYRGRAANATLAIVAAMNHGARLEWHAFTSRTPASSHRIRLNSLRTER